MAVSTGVDEGAMVTVGNSVGVVVVGEGVAVGGSGRVVAVDEGMAAAVRVG